MNLPLVGEKIKKELLANLKNEVNDFHPFLTDLFRRIPEITEVDYTHGINEMGADFILTRKDDLLDSFDYIAVIVKTGKIGQDFTDIERQIEECDIKKLHKEGKRDILPNEIWVINNETISNNAKLKINQKYASKKIKFLYNSDIIKLVDKYYKSFWLSIPSEIDSYLTNTRNHIEKEDSILSLLPSHKEDFYIDHDLEEIDWEIKNLNRGRNKSKISNIIDIIINNNFIFIEGRPGFGKSKLIRHAVKYFCYPHNYLNHKYIPVYVSYNELINVYKCNIKELINDRIKNSIPENNKIILFIDGFDEIFYNDSDEEGKYFLELFEKVFALGNMKVVLTSRPMNFNKKDHLNKFNAVAYEILPLDITKIELFFKELCKESILQNKIVTDIQRSDLFKQLPRSPISAILLATLLNDNSNELPSNLTALYSKYCELMLGRWDLKKQLQSEKEYQAANAIITNISVFLFDNQLTYISIDEAKEFFTSYLSERNLSVNPDLLFDKLTSRSGIIQKQPNYNRVLFKHKTFMEYFKAQSILDKGITGFIDNRVYSYYYKNVYFFYVGLRRDCSDTLMEIFNQKPITAMEQIHRFSNMAEYFLAGYATPYKVIKNNLKNIIIEASHLYLNILNNKIESPLSAFSEFVLLYLFHSVFRHSYSYQFFKPALIEISEDIITEPDIDDDVKIFALYFITTIFVEMGVSNPIDPLLKEYGNKIPFSVSWLLAIDSANIKEKSNLLNKQEKKFKKIMEGVTKIGRDNIIRKYIETPMSLKKGDNTVK